jgi:hypothetical protein
VPRSGTAQVVIALLLLIVGGCGDGSTVSVSTTSPTQTTSSSAAVTSTTSPPATTTTTQAVTTTVGTATTVPATTTTVETGGAEGSGCSPGTTASLPDGRWFGLVTMTNSDSIEFDLACWFSGQAAVEAAAEDGEESPPPNDYYVRNRSQVTRTVPVVADAQTVYYPTGDPSGGTKGSFADWREVVDSRGPWFGIWIVIEGGEAVAIEEQWVP